MVSAVAPGVDEQVLIAVRVQSGKRTARSTIFLYMDVIFVDSLLKQEKNYQARRN